MEALHSLVCATSSSSPSIPVSSSHQSDYSFLPSLPSSPFLLPPSFPPSPSLPPPPSLPSFVYIQVSVLHGQQASSGMDAVEMAYSREVYARNEKVKDGLKEDLVTKFCSTMEQFQDKVGVTLQYPHIWGPQCWGATYSCLQIPCLPLVVDVRWIDRQV